MLNGIVAIEGKWADGSDLLAIPYYARCNRIGGSKGHGGFGGPGAEGGGDGNRSSNGPSSKVWVEEK